ncbi:hypothetical protein MMC31_006053, partial [Peltigera leucophlebia]|nr:hypothetical protein [Peltigera leucophlebia]
MVQRFRLVSLDAREARLGTFSPGEWLFNGSIRSLVDFLSVPVFPSNLYNNKTVEYVSPSGPISYGDTWHRKLSRQDTSPEVATQCLNLSDLPAELIGMVFDELNIIHALCLTLAAQRFWDIGWPFMEKKLMGFMGPWAGHRLVCVGDYPIEDYPHDMLNKDEKEELAKGLDADEYGDDEYGKLHAGSPVDLSSLVDSRYYEVGSDIPPFRLVHILPKLGIDQMR